MTKKLTEQQRQELIKDRLSGISRKQLAVKYCISEAGVKSILIRNDITIPTEMRQKNAYEALIAKNPNHMDRMRLKRTNESFAKQRESITKTFKNKELRDLKSKQSKEWWQRLSEDERKEYLQYRQTKIQESLPVKDYLERLKNKIKDDNNYSQNILKTNKVESMFDYYNTMAVKNGGKLLTYNGSHGSALWECSKGHRWSAKPNTIQQGHWCGVCAFVGFSKAELELYDFVKQFYPDALHNKNVLKTLPRSRVDIYIPSLKKAIELDGEYWHSLERTQMRDKNKDLACFKEQIDLKRISWENYVKNTDSIKTEILTWLAC